MYTKAIDLTAGDSAARAILHGNRSMVQLNMNRADDALVDANEAVRLDRNYLKAYYRQAMAASAQNNYTLARQALQAGLAIKPDEKELLSQLKKVEEKISSGSMNSNTSVPTATKTVKTTSAASSSSVPKPAAAAAPVAAPKPKPQTQNNNNGSSDTKMEVDDDDDAAEIAAANLRGYKVTADGRKTTFFNHDLDEQTKALIGDIKPKRLEAAGEVITTNNTVGSAWNSAGTYEEKVLTPWVTASLAEAFGSINVTMAEGYIPPAIRAAVPDAVTIVIESTGTDNVTGHAQVTLMRGKKKHVCDFSATIQWSLLITFAGERPPAQVSGTLAVQDITADREYEIENFVVTKLNDTKSSLGGLPTDVAAVVNRAAKASDSPLQQEILRKLDAFWTELKTK